MTRSQVFGSDALLSISPKASANAMSANSSDDANSSAAKPANNAANSSGSSRKSQTLSPLSHLTAQSARFIVCEVMIFNPDARKRKYMWDKQERTSFNFQCMLVSTDDPTQYMLGSSRKRYE